MPKDKIKVGIRGEFLVASKLSQLGYIVAPTLKNTPGIDLLVSDGFSAKLVQVKTTENAKADWICSKPKKSNDDLVYIFVALNVKAGKSAIPAYHIVPCPELIKDINKQNAIYAKKHPKFAKSGKKGVQHFTDLKGKYNEEWKFLGLKKLYLA